MSAMLRIKKRLGASMESTMLDKDQVDAINKVVAKLKEIQNAVETFTNDRADELDEQKQEIADIVDDINDSKDDDEDEDVEFLQGIFNDIDNYTSTLNNVDDLNKIIEDLEKHAQKTA